MAKNFGKLQATISADSSDFKKSLNDASKQAESFKDKVSKSLESVTTATNEISPALGNVVGNITDLASASGGPLTLALAAAAGGLVAMTSRSIESAQAFEDFRDQTQLSVEELAKFEYIALKNGTSLEDFAGSIVKMQKALREARDGNAETSVTFARLGINIDEALKDKDGGVQRVAKAINDMASSTERAEVVNALFGKSGAKMTANLLDIAEGAGEATNRTEEAQAEFDKFYKTLNEVKISAGNASDAISIRLVSGINNLIAKLREAATDAAPLWSAIINAPIGKTTLAKSTGNIANNMFGGGPKVEDPRLSTGLIGDANYQSKIKQQDDLAKKDEEIKNRAIARNAVYKAGLADLKKQLDDGKLSQAQYNQKVKDYVDNFNKVEVKGGDKAGTSKSSSKDEKPKADPIDQLYLKTLDEIEKKTRDLNLTSQDLSATEKEIATLRASPEYALMSEKKQKEIDLAYSNLLLLEKSQAAQKQLNDLIAATPTAKLEQQKILLEKISDEWNKGNKGLFGDTTTQEAGKKYGEVVNAALGNAADKTKTVTGEIFTLNTAVDFATTRMSSAFEDFAIKGKLSFSGLVQEVLAGLAQMIIKQQIFNALQAGGKAMAGSDTGWISTIGKAIISSQTGGAPVASANGNVFTPGFGGPNLIPFANGGIFDSPITFPMSGGRNGLMAESGPEAVIPLTRTNGKLGVNASGLGNTNVINQVSVTVNTDKNSNADEIGAKTSEAVIRALAKQEIQNATRYGGLLSGR